MKAKDLRNSILMMAVQGKLVEQNPHDEPANVLLEKIRAVKAELIKQKIIKKEKPLPEITEEEKPFDLPNGWEWVRVNEIFNFIDYRGKTPTKIVEGIPLVTAKNVKQGYNDYTVSEYISFTEYKSRQGRGISRKGDILFTTEAPLGNVSIADLDVFSAGQRLITLQQYTSYISTNNRLIMYFMLSKIFKDELMTRKTGTTVTGIKAAKLKELLLPFPPLAEQQRIVDKLEELMPKIDKYEQAETMLTSFEQKFPDDMRSSILQAAVQGKLVAQNPDDEPASVLLEKICAEKAELIKQKKIKTENMGKMKVVYHSY